MIQDFKLLTILTWIHPDISNNFFRYMNYGMKQHAKLQGGENRIALSSKVPDALGICQQATNTNKNEKLASTAKIMKVLPFNTLEILLIRKNYSP